MKDSKKSLVFALTASTLMILASGPEALAFGKRRSHDKDPSFKLPIQFSDDIPQNQYDLMTQDLKSLSSLKLEGMDPETVRILKLREPGAPALQSWLEERVQYVVGEKFDLDGAAFVASSSYSYENPFVMPEIERPPVRPVTRPTATEPEGSPEASEENTIKTIMTNLGGAVYMAGKQAGTLFGIDLGSVGQAVMTSPRVGLIQVGEGLFMPLRKGPKDLSLPLYAMMRLETFFHEARHGDGNGKSLSFVHAICPEGHTYAGYNACDRNLNGPYTVGARVLKDLIPACESCSVEEKEVLKLVMLDSFDRVIKETKVDESGRPSELSLRILIAETELLICQLEQARVSRGECRAHEERLQKLRAEAAASGEGGPFKLVPSTEWDDRPEGHR